MSVANALANFRALSSVVDFLVIREVFQVIRSNR